MGLAHCLEGRVHALGHLILVVPSHVLRERLGVDLAPGFLEALRQTIGLGKDAVGNGYGGLHTASITTAGETRNSRASTCAGGGNLYDFDLRWAVPSGRHPAASASGEGRSESKTGPKKSICLRHELRLLSLRLGQKGFVRKTAEFSGDTWF